LTEDHIM